MIVDLKDFDGPPSLYQDEVFALGRFVVARLAILVNAKSYEAAIKTGDTVLWTSEEMCAELNKSNLGLPSIEYLQPAPDSNPSFDHKVTDIVRKIYPNKKYPNGEYVIGITKSKPARLPNHISLFRGLAHSRGYVSLTEVNQEWVLKYWPTNCLTLASWNLCQWMTMQNAIPEQQFAARKVPDEIREKFAEWDMFSANPSRFSAPFIAP